MCGDATDDLLTSATVLVAWTTLCSSIASVVDPARSHPSSPAATTAGSELKQRKQQQQQQQQQRRKLPAFQLRRTTKSAGSTGGTSPSPPANSQKPQQQEPELDWTNLCSSITTVLDPPPSPATAAEGSAPQPQPQHIQQTGGTSTSTGAATTSQEAQPQLDLTNLYTSIATALDPPPSPATATEGSQPQPQHIQQTGGTSTTSVAATNSQEPQQQLDWTNLYSSIATVLDPSRDSLTGGSEQQQQHREQTSIQQEKASPGGTSTTPQGSNRTSTVATTVSQEPQYQLDWTTLYSSIATALDPSPDTATEGSPPGDTCTSPSTTANLPSHPQPHEQQEQRRISTTSPSRSTLSNNSSNSNNSRRGSRRGSFGNRSIWSISARTSNNSFNKGRRRKSSSSKDSDSENSAASNSSSSYWLDSIWWNTKVKKYCVKPAQSFVHSISDALLLNEKRKNKLGIIPGDTIIVMTTNPEQQECSLCCNPMTVADWQFPLHCPSAHCDFNMCTSCIQAMQKSDADGYEYASDGSQQVKYHLACPMCRSKYQTPNSSLMILSSTQPQSSGGEEKKEPYSSQSEYYTHPTSSSSSAAQPVFIKTLQPHHWIVTYVVLLRQAYSVYHLLHEKDCDLSATNLKRKHDFLNSTSLEDVQEAAMNYQVYIVEIEKPVPPQLSPKLPMEFFDWDALAKLLVPRSEKQQQQSSSLSSQSPSQPQERARRDPTLFRGWEELLSLSDQEYVTQLMYSGDARNLAHAAHIMHSVLLSCQRQPLSTRAVEVMSQFRSQAPTPFPSPFAPSSPPPPPLHNKEATKICGRFPLPNHMPRCVVLPVYDPTLGDRQAPIRLETKKETSLVVAQVRGVAGRSGLRRGDVVTHVNGHTVQTLAEYQEQVQGFFQEYQSARSAEEQKDRQDLMIVVNAHGENAQLLQERDEAMKKAKVTF